MTIEELKKRLNTLSDNELYDLARIYLQSEIQGQTHNSAKLDIIYQECSKRNIKIFDDALQDSAAEKRAIDEARDNSKFSSAFAKRIDHMKKHELEMMLAERDSEGFSIIKPIQQEKAIDEIFQAITKKNTSFFIIRGDSMAGEGLADGDIVSAEIGAIHKNGETVLIRINDSLLVKNYYFKGNSILLKSANPEYPDISPQPADNFEVIGIVRFVLQKK